VGLVTTAGQRELVGAMFTDGERLWEIIGCDGVDAEGGPAFLIADAGHSLAFRPRDRPSRRITQRGLDAMTRVGFGA
jgi:hypothetical protein